MSSKPSDSSILPLPQEWYLEINGKLRGPISTTDVRIMIETGVITPATLIRSSREGTPRTVASIQGLGSGDRSLDTPASVISAGDHATIVDQPTMTDVGAEPLPGKEESWHESLRRAARSSQQVAVVRDEKRPNGSWALWFLASCAACLVLLPLAVFVVTILGASRSAPAIHQELGAFNEKIEAWKAAKELASARLNAPSNAVWPTYKDELIRAGDEGYAIDAYLDAPGSASRNPRSNFTVVIKRTADKKGWSLESLEFRDRP